MPSVQVQRLSTHDTFEQEAGLVCDAARGRIASRVRQLQASLTASWQAAAAARGKDNAGPDSLSLNPWMSMGWIGV